MSVIGKEFATKFIEKTAKHLNFNINVMNEKGIIIASKDEGRIGDFHEVAYNLLNGKMVNGVVQIGDEEKYINTKAGVNMFIEYGNDKVGVICVTGNPNEVESFAGLVKTSMEAMLEYELQKESKNRKKTSIEQFLYYLLFEENIDYNIARKLALNSHVSIDKSRIAIVIKNQSELDNIQLVQILKNVPSAAREDLYIIARNDNIIVLKYVDSKDEVLVDFKYDVIEYYNQIMSALPKYINKHQFVFYVGTLQNTLENYRCSYSNAQTLCTNITYKEGLHFFNDHILSFYRNLVSKDQYDNLFSVYKDVFNDTDRVTIAETVEVLSNNNYNVVNSAKALFIHRNTLVFRLNKIKQVLHIDPITNSSDREFLNELAYYFKKIMD